MRKLSIAVLISNMLILIGFGHGVGPIVVIEMILPWSDGVRHTLSLNENYNHSIFAAALLSLLGHLLVLSFLITKKNLLMVIGIVIMWMGLFYLTKTLTINSVALFSFYSSLPFLGLSVIYIFRFIRLTLTPVSNAD